MRVIAWCFLVEYAIRRNPQIFENTQTTTFIILLLVYAFILDIRNNF